MQGLPCKLCTPVHHDFTLSNGSRPCIGACRACESRARVHHKFYLGSGRSGSGSSLRGAGGSDGDLTYQSGYQSTYNSTLGSGAFPPTNQTLSQRGDSRRLTQIFSHVALRRSMSMQPPLSLSQGSSQVCRQGSWVLACGQERRAGGRHAGRVAGLG